ncbi:MAG TPA: HNH endonuclease domain-containing protein [Tenuifilaceae bacterium]|nr:HNH endonuclease domain-containing protein [Tenuifilaceae bacterium]
MNLPQDNRLEISRLVRIYNNTVATYKYYWFLSFLEIFVKTGKRYISFWEIIVGMISEAWYPIHYFRLSFGKSDSLYNQIIELQKDLSIPIDASRTDIKKQINDKLGNTRVKSLLRIFTLNVPYRFLSPWISYTTDKDVVNLSQAFTNNCIYAIRGEAIAINPLWEQYLNDNYLILRDFTFWNLTVFLQKRNPNVPDLPSKLVKPITRDSLVKQRNFWDTYIDITGSMKCIYTGKELFIRAYDLDHFLPWSFVSHSLLWNLLPADASINSSKSNNLPSLDTYLEPFARLHQKAIQAIYPKNPNNKLLEDYLTLHGSLTELVDCSEQDFINIYKKTFLPLAQIAENMGFKYWQNSSRP